MVDLPVVPYSYLLEQQEALAHIEALQEVQVDLRGEHHKRLQDLPEQALHNLF